MIKKSVSYVGKTLKFHPGFALYLGSKLVYSAEITLRLDFYDHIQVCETRLIIMVLLPDVLSGQNIIVTPQNDLWFGEYLYILLMPFSKIQRQC